MIICPNLKNPDVAREFNELVLATSEAAAYHIWSLNNGNAIDKAPNGAESKLFSDLLLLFNGDRTKAIQAKAKVYGNSFLNWFGNWIEADSETFTFYQGRKSETVDGRRYNYWTISKEEASKSYGPVVRSRRINTKGFLLKYTFDGKEFNYSKEFELLNEEFKKKYGYKYGFDILHNDKEGLDKQNKFFEFIESKGYLGYREYVGIDENPYVVTFGDKDGDSENSVSKVVDLNGEPLIVYHGSNYENDSLRRGDWSQNALPYASYFAPYKYATNKYYFAAFLNIKNPIYEHPDLSEDAIQDESIFKKYVLNEGYDGIISSYDKSTNVSEAKEIVVVNKDQIKSIIEDNYKSLIKDVKDVATPVVNELNERPVAPVINELALVRQQIADFELLINKIIKTQREVRNKYVNNERHVSYSINTEDGPIYATHKHLDNGKSIFGLVTVGVDIDKNTVSSILIDPTYVVNDTIGLNFNRQHNSIKSNFYNLSYNLLQMFLLEGKNIIYSPSKNLGVDKKLVEQILADDREAKKIAEKYAKPVISLMFGEDAWKAYSIYDEHLVDLTKYNDQELGFSGVLYYGFKINVELLANAIKSEHPEVKIDNEFIKLILATQDDSNLKSKDDIEFGKLWISKLDLLIQEIHTLLQPLKERERKLKNDNINEMLSEMRALGESLEEECGVLPF